MISNSVKSETSSGFHCYSPGAWSHLWHLVGIQKNMGRNKFLEIQKAEVSHVVHRSYLGEAECSLQSLSCSLPQPPVSTFKFDETPSKVTKSSFLKAALQEEAERGSSCCSLLSSLSRGKLVWKFKTQRSFWMSHPPISPRKLSPHAKG